MPFRENAERKSANFWGRIRDSVVGLRESLRQRWAYRKENAASSASSGASAPAGQGRLGRFWHNLNDTPGIGATTKRALTALLILLLFYYPVGMVMVHHVGDDPNFAPTGENAAKPGGSQAVATMAALIDREVNDNSWVANDPFFQPGVMLDNMPSYQTGIMSALARFSFEMTDQVGRTRGSSAADPDLQKAAGLLQYPGDVWLWNPSVSLAPRASSESQYRSARKALLSYNDRLATGNATFEKRADNLMATIERISSDLGSQSATLDKEVREHSGDFIDTNADNVFYNTKGRLYGYYLILKALGEDFAPIIKEKNLTSNWNQMLDTFREAAELDPFIIVNGRPDATFQPSHLSSQGFYLLRARTQAREVSNVLLK
tara:strand:+ start:130853 stop:131980 length:1128 start_codon:yes stop_codon:yes gene_type:complete